jgi:hypothetical protein
MQKQVKAVQLWSREASGAFNSWRDSLDLSKYKSGNFAWSIHSEGIDDPGGGTAWRSRKFHKAADALTLLREGFEVIEDGHTKFTTSDLIRWIPAVTMLDMTLGEEFAAAVAEEIARPHVDKSPNAGKG